MRTAAATSARGPPAAERPVISASSMIPSPPGVNGIAVSRRGGGDTPRAPRPPGRGEAGDQRQLDDPEPAGCERDRGEQAGEGEHRERLDPADLCGGDPDEPQ